MTDESSIEEDLARTRSRMDERLSELQERLTPARLANDAFSYMRGSDTGEFASNLLESAKRNPIPAVITGIGLAWLMASDARGGDAVRAEAPPSRWSSAAEFDEHLGTIDTGVTRGSGETEASFNDRLHDARGKTLGLARAAQETSADYASRVSDAIGSTRASLTARAHDLGDGMKAGLSSGAQGVAGSARSMQHGLAAGTRQTSEQMARAGQALRGSGGDLVSSIMDNPMMLGAIGLGVGALLGAIVPRTEAEEAALGGIAGQARTALRDVAQEALDRGGAAAQAAVQAGRDSAQAHGLTGEQDFGDLAKQAGSGKLSGAAAEVAGDVLKAAEKTLRKDG